MMGAGEEMTQIMYAHVNKWIQKIKTYNVVSDKDIFIPISEMTE
jgi:Ulp1 family protease